MEKSSTFAGLGILMRQLARVIWSSGTIGELGSARRFGGTRSFLPSKLPQVQADRPDKD